MTLIPVAEARSRILKDATPTEREEIDLGDALGRVLAEDIAATRTQPPFPTTAMDGYAVRAVDVAAVPAALEVIGRSAAGHRHQGSLRPGQAVRIFTGAPLPEGADAIVIQEDTERDGDVVTVLEAATENRHIRPEGLDFRKGEILLTAGTRLEPRQIALAAAMNCPRLPVRRRPVVAILSTGDELVQPGGDPGPDQIIASNAVGIAALCRRAGAEALDLGIAADDRDDIAGRVALARDKDADILVTLGGASVGDHDLVQPVLADLGLALDFWRIAMRPGKPLMFGRLDRLHVMGLPGNPVSSMVCGLIFLEPLIAKLLGRSGKDHRLETATLGEPLPANDRREDYVRSRLTRDDDGGLCVEAFPRQDSSMLAVFTSADALIVRPPHAPAAEAGETVAVLRLP